jgi:hypothetical protein
MYAVATVATGMALLTGCGGSTASPPTSPVAKKAGTSAPSAGTSTSPSATANASPTPRPRTQAQLRKALLALDDMPTGFEVERPTGGDDGPDLTGKGSACQHLAKELSAKAPAGSLATAEVSLSGGQDGPFIGETLDAYASGTAVQAPTSRRCAPTSPAAAR